MANTRNLTPLTDEAIRALPGFKTVKQIDAPFVKTSATAAVVKSAQTQWIKSIAPPEVVQPAAKAVQGVVLTSAHLDSLRAIQESTAATAEIVNQQLAPDQMLGVLHSSLTTLEYTRLSSEYKKRSSAASAADKKTVDAQWQKIVEAATGAYAAAGVKGLKPADIDKMATELNRKPANFNAVTNIANSAKDAAPATDAQPSKVLGSFVTQVGVLPDLVVTVISMPPDFCSKPLVQGSFTKHFSYSFNLQVTLTVWCPTWTNPFRTCQKTYTIAGVSFSVDLSVGYKVTCCGATAWGSAAVQACASIIGVSVCASCTATITAVTGVGRSGSGSSCSYGLGVNAELKCSLAGITLLHLNAPFGWTITGPCPPPALPCK